MTISKIILSCVNSPANMYTALRKIHKDKDAEPTEFEESVAQVEPQTAIFTCFGTIFHLIFFLSLQSFFDLENTNQELKSDLKDLYINSAV